MAQQPQQPQQEPQQPQQQQENSFQPPSPQSPEQRYHLSQVLRGHSLDVKALSAAFDPLSSSELLFSASRDETGVCWSREAKPQECEQSQFQKRLTYTAERYCNAIEYLAPCSALPRGMLLLGSLDSRIRCFDPTRPDKPVQILSEHWDNVSVIKASSSAHLPSFISGSWDKTARVWCLSQDSSSAQLWQCSYTLRGHEQAVWGVQIVQHPHQENNKAETEGKYLTSSADLFVRLFHGDQLVSVYAGHTDVVRTIKLFPHSVLVPDAGTDQKAPEQLFATCSNDCTIKVWSLDPKRSPTPGNGGEPIRTLRGHSSIVYDLDILPLSDSDKFHLASSAEDGTVRIWDWFDESLRCTIPQPAISAWSVAVLKPSLDIATGLSDGTVRIYHASHTKDDPSRVFASPEEQQDHTESVQKVVAAVNARLDPQEPDPTKQQQKTQFESQWYDFVLQVDVSDDAEPIPLPVNRADDPRSVARDFLQKHDLPDSYEEQIVSFISMVLGSETDGV